MSTGSCALLGRVHAKMPPYVLRIAGGAEPGFPEYEARLRGLAQDMSVEFVGEVADATGFLRGLDLFALVAEPAGCPNASLEAMARGLAVIATDAGGMSEQVQDGVTGRLVGRDDEDALGRSAPSDGGRPRPSAQDGLGRPRSGPRSFQHGLDGRPLRRVVPRRLKKPPYCVRQRTECSPRLGDDSESHFTKEEHS